MVVYHCISSRGMKLSSLHSGMAEHVWEDELMYYAESNYMDNYLDNMMTTFGIVSMEDRWTDKENNPYQLPHCNCLMTY